jgi:cytoskeleton protein RodZ
MLSLGQRFREQREKQKVSLEAIAERTKINAKYLQAIETENFDDLPAGLFRRSFVRQYADALHLNGPDLESDIDEIFGSTERSPVYTPGLESEVHADNAISVEPTREPPMEPAGEHRLAWSIGLFIFALVACSGIYALWQHTQEGDRVPQAALARQTVGASPRLVPRTNVPVSQPAVADPPALSEPSPEPDSPPQPTQLQAAQPEPPKPQPAAESELSEAARLKNVPPEALPAEPAPAPSAEASAAVAEPKVSEPKRTPIVVQVSANEKVWVRTTSDRQTVFRGMLGAQERKSFSGAERTRILIGDAGAVSVIWNGKSIGPIGRSGQMRVIEFTPDTFQILSP